MATIDAGELYTAGKLAEALGASQGKVRKLIEELRIEPAEVKRGCKYYGPAARDKLQNALRSE